MYTTITCPIRISLVGGSSDLDEYIEKHGRGSVISFTPQLNTYLTISKSILGKNNFEKKYIVNYSKREEVSNIANIENDLVRVFFEEFKVAPCSVHMTSDVFSSGSGLAVSSSYACCLAKALAEMQDKILSNVECGNIAHKMEKKVNPLLGMQDVFGCCVGGFKKIEFSKNGPPKYTFLPTTIFDSFNICLYFTGLTRSSTEVLKTVSVPNQDTFNPLVDEAERCLVVNDYRSFLKMVREGWEKKKATSKKILNFELVKMDNWINGLHGHLAHKLCGAGSGGFFLVFFEKDAYIPPGFCPISLSPTGIRTILHIPGSPATNTSIRGIVAGAFDVIHPGYCRMFKECKNHCSHLTVALHDDPSIERNKIKPIHTLQEREEILLSLNYVDEVIPYQYESDLEKLLQKGFDVRFLGDDYKNKNYTGEQLDIPIVYISRDHEYSTTNLKKLIWQTFDNSQGQS